MLYKIDFFDKLGNIFDTKIISCGKSDFTLRGWSRHHRTLVVSNHMSGKITHIINVFKENSDMDFDVTVLGKYSGTKRYPLSKL